MSAKILPPLKTFDDECDACFSAEPLAKEPHLHTLTGVLGTHGVVGALREMPTGVVLLILFSDIVHLLEHLIAVVGVLFPPLTLKLWEPCEELHP